MVIGHDMKQAQHASLTLRAQWLLGILCLCTGAVTLAVRWIPSDIVRITSGIVIMLALLALTLFMRRSATLRPFWELSFAFFVFAVVQVLNNSLPGFFATYVLHALPVPGNPESSTIAGTVIIQLLQTAIAIVPIIVLTLVAGQKLSTIYAGLGRAGLWLILSTLAVILMYGFSASPRAGRYIPTHGPITLSHLLAVTPALLVLVISNGFQEEFLFRGLFLGRYQTFFGVGVANVLQALVFAFAHAGITYTASNLLFIGLVIFPLGLIFGFLMRKTNGSVTPSLLHAAFDIPIYVAFLSYVW